MLLTDIDAELGIITCVWRDRPPQSGVAHGFSLIPASGVGVVVDGEKTGGNGVEGTFNRDITKDETTCLDAENL